MGHGILLKPRFLGARIGRSFCALLSLLLAVITQAAPVFLETGPHHRVVQEMRSQTNELGEVSECMSQYTEIANGLNRWDSEKKAWVEAEAFFEFDPQSGGGVVAQRGQHTATLAPQINSPGSFALLTPDHL